MIPIQTPIVVSIVLKPLRFALLLQSLPPLTSCYLPRATQDLFFLLGCRWRLRCWISFPEDLSRTLTALRLRCEVGTLFASVE
jgi:hypothetical protein